MGDEKEFSEEETASSADSWLEPVEQPELSLDTDSPSVLVDPIVEVGDEVSYHVVGVTDNVRRVRIVAGESQPELGTINQRTPLAEGLLGTKVGDRISVTLPSGSERFEIVDIIK